MSKADVNELNELHALVAKVIKKRLEGDDVTPQDVAQALKFLKDNNIQAEYEFSPALQEIKEQLDNVSDLPFPTEIEDEAK